MLTARKHEEGPSIYEARTNSKKNKLEILGKNIAFENKMIIMITLNKLSQWHTR